MTNIKRNKTVARSIIIAGTILAGLGIWTSVTHASLPISTKADAPIAAAPAPNTNSNFSQNDAFLTQPGIQVPNSGQQSGSSQPAAARAPRLRTRGS